MDSSFYWREWLNWLNWREWLNMMRGSYSLRGGGTYSQGSPPQPTFSQPTVTPRPIDEWDRRLCRNALFVGFIVGLSVASTFFLVLLGVVHV